MYLFQIWFSLSAPAAEDAIYDSYAMRKFTDIDFVTERYIENRKSSVRCRVEYAFRSIKCQFS